MAQDSGLDESPWNGPMATVYWHSRRSEEFQSKIHKIAEKGDELRNRRIKSMSTLCSESDGCSCVANKVLGETCLGVCCGRMVSCIEYISTPWPGLIDLFTKKGDPSKVKSLEAKKSQMEKDLELKILPEGQCCKHPVLLNITDQSLTELDLKKAKSTAMDSLIDQLKEETKRMDGIGELLPTRLHYGKLHRNDLLHLKENDEIELVQKYEKADCTKEFRKVYAPGANLLSTLFPILKRKANEAYTYWKEIEGRQTSTSRAGPSHDVPLSHHPP